MSAAVTGLPSRILEGWTMTVRGLRHSVRNPEALLITLALPVLLMLIFTIVFGGALNTGGGSYTNFVAPAVIVVCASYGAASTAVGVTNDMTTGIIRRLRTMNVTASAVLIGHVVASMVRNAVATALVVLTALAIGFRPEASLAQWTVALLLLALFLLSMTVIAAAFGLLVRSPEAAGALSFVVLFLPYLSGAFVPLSTLPGWLQPFARNQPFTPVIEALRGLLSGTGAGEYLLPAVLWWAGLLVVGAVAGVAFWSRSRRRG